MIHSVSSFTSCTEAVGSECVLSNDRVFSAVEELMDLLPSGMHDGMSVRLVTDNLSLTVVSILALSRFKNTCIDCTPFSPVELKCSKPDVSPDLLIIEAGMGIEKNDFSNQGFDVIEIDADLTASVMNALPASPYRRFYTEDETVMIDSNQLQEYADWFNNRFEIEGQRVCFQANRDFITLIKNIVPVLMAGADIVFTDTVNDTDDFIQLLKDMEIRHLFIAAAGLNRLCEQLQKGGHETHLRYIVTCYDSQYPITGNITTCLYESCPGFCEVVSLFGYLTPALPQCYNSYSVHSNESERLVVGRSVFSNRNFILDNKYRFVPPDIVGTVFIDTAFRDHAYVAAQKNTAFIQATVFNQQFRLLKTSHKARYNAAKMIQIAVNNPGEVFIDGRLVKIDAVKELIEASGKVKDSTIIKKPCGKAERLYCFYAASGNASGNNQASAFQFADDPEMQEIAMLLRLPFLPLKDDGTVDIAELGTIDVIPGHTWQKISDLIANKKEITGFFTAGRITTGSFSSNDAFKSQQNKAANEPASNTGSSPETTEDWAIDTGKPAIISGANLEVSSDFTSLITILTASLIQFPGKGITYIDNNGNEQFELYSNLFLASRHTAQGLRNKGLKRGDRVVLQISSTNEFFTVFWACLAEGIEPLVMAPASVYARGNAQAGKLYHAWLLLEQPAIIASDDLLSGLMQMKAAFEMEQLSVVSCSSLSSSVPAVINHSVPTGTAFILLTSGSTGMPKCIPVSHASAIAHINGLKQYLHIDAQNVVVNILPIDHITPLLSLHIRAMITGAHQVQVQTSAFVSNPFIWFDVLQKYRGTHSFSPNFAYKLIADRLASNPGKQWDLSSVKYFKNGGELVSYDVAREFLRITKDFGVTEHQFQPAYGLTEASGAITITESFSDSTVLHLKKGTLTNRPVKTTASDPERVTFMTVGAPLPGVSIRIVDEKGNLVNEQQVGTIQVKGAVVTNGYINNEKANRASFADGWLNTGDYGFIINNSLVVTGRSRDIIIINGVNYYAYEFEQVIKSLPLVDNNYVAACAVQDAANGTENIAIFFSTITDVPQLVPGIVKNIRKTVSSYFGVDPVYIIPVDKTVFPRTDTGKLNRISLFNQLEAGVFDDTIQKLNVALRQPGGDGQARMFTHQQLCIYYTAEHGEADFSDILVQFPALRNRIFAKRTDELFNIDAQGVAALSALEEGLFAVKEVSGCQSPAMEKLTEIWESILNKRGIGSNDNFFELGGNSLKAIQIISRINKELNVSVDFKDIFSNPTIAELDKVVLNAYNDIYQTIKPVNIQESYPLSNAQKRLWILDKQEGNHIAYNMPMGYYLNGSLDLKLLELAFSSLLSRHEILRTVFVTVDGEPRQKISEELANFRIRYMDMRNGKEKDILSRKIAAEEFTTAFSLEKGPLFRTCIIRLEEEKYLFLFTMHHIISDGWSLKVIFNELALLYNSLVIGVPEPLAPLTIQYKDYAAWHNNLLMSGGLKVHRDYWYNKLASKNFEHVLPPDFSPAEKKSYNGNTLVFKAADGTLTRLHNFTASHSTTVFILVQAIIKILFSKYSGRKEITIGAPIAGRGHEYLEGQIGFYLNNLVLHDELDDDDSFLTFLAAVKQTNVDAYKHQLYPYDSLVEELHTHVTSDSNPFYDVMIVMETEGMMLDGNSKKAQVFEGLEVAEFTIDYAISKLDLTFFFSLENELTFNIEYRTDLFYSNTIKKIASDFLMLLDTVFEQPSVSVRRLKNTLSSGAEKKEHFSFKEKISEAISDDF
jgi:acyl-CoA synthetase (AMP-forming)/AMP-acid ligase II/acyl carrier protein